MTHHTDAERAEFEDGAWYWVEKEGWFGEPPTIAPACYKACSDTWRSAAFSGIPTREVKVLGPCRRAPAAQVPQGWKLVPDDANMTDEQAEAICAVAKVCGGGAYDIYRAALAAAPQPPEAAPVQLPEPDAWRYTDARGHYRYRGARPGFAVEYPILKPEALYTEQQVRELLAAHDIQERST